MCSEEKFDWADIVQKHTYRSLQVQLKYGSDFQLRSVFLELFE